MKKKRSLKKLYKILREVRSHREQMAALFQRAIENGQRDLTIKCADAVCYEEIMAALIDNQEIFDYLQDRESGVAYAQNDKQLSLTFWVTNE